MGGPAAVPWHYVRPNESSRYPRSIVTFDTEARIAETRKGTTHSFRLAAASFDRLGKGRPEPIQSETMLFTEAGDLWSWIDSKTRTKGRLVCFAHNLAYDLRLSCALETLPRLGWELEFLTLDGSKCVARYRRDGRSLVLTDSGSYLPAALEKIAPMVGMAKPPLPRQDAPDEQWAHRCLEDVRITRAAMLRLLAWLEANDCGMFRYTGPAQSMACYRHRFMDRYSLLAHKDGEALEAERRAAWAGRCEVWRHGPTKERLYEWDFELAYLHVARRAYLPTQLQGELSGDALAHWRSYARRRRVLLECEVETKSASVPAALDDHIAWPVGEFQTTLWDNEAELCRQFGGKVTPLRAWAYKASPALATWAAWLLGLLAEDGLPVDALERLMLKHWARALVGRFGMRHPVFERVARLPESSLELTPYVDLDTGEEGAYLQSGHDWFERSGMVDAPDAMPAVMGYIMAEARCALLRLVTLAGADNVYYLDTDSAIVNEAGHAEIEKWSEVFAGPPVRLKGVYRSADFLAPRQIIVNAEPRMAGVPRRAVQVETRRFEADTWEGLAESVRRGHPSQVRVSRRAFNVSGRDRRRRHLADGRTEPLVVGSSAVQP